MSIIIKELLHGKYMNRDGVINFLKSNTKYKEDLKDALDKTPDLLKDIPLVGIARPHNYSQGYLCEGELTNEMFCHLIIPFIIHLYESTNLLSYSEYVTIIDRLKYHDVKGLELFKYICPVYFNVFRENIINIYKDLKIPYLKFDYKTTLIVPLNDISFEDVFPYEYKKSVEN